LLTLIVEQSILKLIGYTFYLLLIDKVKAKKLNHQPFFMKITCITKRRAH
jgi:hypothetical protein